MNTKKEMNTEAEVEWFAAKLLEDGGRDVYEAAAELLVARPILRELAKQPCQCAIVMEPGPDGGLVQTSRSQCLYCRARAASEGQKQ